VAKIAWCQMNDLKTLWSILVAHWPFVAPVLALILNDIINSVTAYPKTETWLHVLSDMLALHAHSDSPAGLKAPFTKSPSPSVVGSAVPTLTPGGK
jgi:hypothetical protein